MHPFSLSQRVLLLLSTLLGLCQGLEFTGSEGQWARYVRWDASTRSELTFQFKTAASDALILYFDDGGYCDFLLLTVTDGKLQLCFSVDCAETTVTSEKSVNDSRWHFATVSRHNLRTVLALDGQTKADEVRPQRQFMKIVSDLFLGGVPGDIRTSAITLPTVRELPPFKGVITDLNYGNKVPTLINSQKVRLEMMGLCTENPCENGGHCSMADGEPYCDCSKTGYTGRTCGEGKIVQSYRPMSLLNVDSKVQIMNAKGVYTIFELNELTLFSKVFATLYHFHVEKNNVQEHVDRFNSNRKHGHLCVGGSSFTVYFK